MAARTATITAMSSRALCRNTALASGQVLGASCDVQTKLSTRYAVEVECGDGSGQGDKCWIPVEFVTRGIRVLGVASCVCTWVLKVQECRIQRCFRLPQMPLVQLLVICVILACRHDAGIDDVS